MSVNIREAGFDPRAQEADLDLGQRPGDILLFYRPEGTSKVISWLTRSPYYHVAICEDVLHVVEARPRGVVRRDLRTSEGGHVFKVIPGPGGAGAAALAWARLQIGESYDEVGMFAILLDRVFARFHFNYKPRKNRFTCGEFVATAFNEAGVRLFPDLPLGDVIPADFSRLLPGRAVSPSQRLDLRGASRS